MADKQIDRVGDPAKRKRRIIHVIFSFTTGGAENLIVDLVNNQVDNSQVYLFVINDLYDVDLLKTIDKRVKVILINRKIGSKNIFKIVHVNLLVAFIKPDVIHCHNEKGINLLMLFRQKAIITVHDVQMDVSLFYKYRRIIAISKAVKEDIELRSPKKMEAQIVHNGVDFSRIELKNNWEAGKPFNIIQVSRLVHEKKGQDLLLEAIVMLKNNNEFNNIKVHFVGSGDSYTYLKSLTNRYLLNENVFFLDSKDRNWIYKNLKNFHVLVQPSRYEGFGLTIIEGIAAKIPVIASELEGPQEILGNGKYGELFKCNDSKDLAAKLEKVLKQYHNDEVKTNAEEAYHYAVGHFSLQAMLNGYDKIYNSLN